jgi:hypothetical protein
MGRGLDHYVFAFHASTFECIAGASHVEAMEGPMANIVIEMGKRLYRPQRWL